MNTAGLAVHMQRLQLANFFMWCGKGHLLGSIVAHCAANCTKYSESVIALAAR